MTGKVPGKFLLKTLLTESYAYALVLVALCAQP